MADCSYVRCVQQRRFIRRELSKWTKDMFYIVGLERVAEELMGRRKWKLFQEVLAQSHLDTNTTNLAILPITTTNSISVETGNSAAVSNIYNNGHQHSSSLEKELQNHYSNQQESEQQQQLEEESEHKLLNNHTKENSIKTEPHIQIKEESNTAIGTFGEINENQDNITKKVLKTEIKQITENNINIVDHSAALNNNKQSEETALEKLSSLPKSPTQAPPTIRTTPPIPQSLPEDWKPQKKCYFCVDGKLITVNERGEVVAESGPAHTEPELANRQRSVESDSDDSSDCSDIETGTVAATAAAATRTPATVVDTSTRFSAQQNSALTAASHKAVTDFLQNSLQQRSMTSFESMTAQLATIASLNGFQQMYPTVLYNQLLQMHSNPIDQPSAVSGSNNVASPMTGSTNNSMPTEQPLDLSAKPTGNNNHDSRQIYRAKPRLSTIAGRRTYTEDELQNALNDILSGKLGTRRAAVLYGIPRSTLRNKVYKLGSEQKREQSKIHVLDVDDDEEKELSGPEDDIEKSILSHDLSKLSSSSPETVPTVLSSSGVAGVSGGSTSSSSPATAAAAAAAAASMQNFATVFENSIAKVDSKERLKLPTTTVMMSSATTTTTTSISAINQLPHQQQQQHQQSNLSNSSSSSSSHQQPQLISQTSPPPPPITSNPWLDPVLLQNIILAGMQQKCDDPMMFQELMSVFIRQQAEMMKKQNVTNDLTNNGKSISTDSTRHLHSNMSSLHHHQQQQQQQQQQQHQQQQQQQHHHQPHHHQHHLHSRLTKSTESPDHLLNSSGGDILIDPNEDSAVILKIPSFKPIAGSSSSCKNGSGGVDDITPRNSPPLSLPRISPGISSPHSHSNNDSPSPPISLSGSNMPSLRDVIANSINRTFNQQQNCDNKSDHSIDQQHYKRPSISVIKNLGGTDTTRFASSPNLMTSIHSGSNNSLNNQLGGPGGKGTRPKRGKYRNYDRDSLVEAVKAVQRGEMSVHRAGSYYGVPHSTLEYKVKERHLMRPRKREPKPQPLDTSGGGGSSSGGISGTNSMKPQDMSSNLRAAFDKSSNKQQSSSSMSTTKPPLKTPPFPSSASSDQSTNGLKLSQMYDPNQLHQYPAQLFWPHPPGLHHAAAAAAAAAVAGLPIDFARTASGSGSGIGPSASSSSACTTPTSLSAAANDSNNFITAQMMQRFQEDALRQAAVAASGGGSSGGGGGGGGGGSISGHQSASSSSSSSKTAREMAESLYDGTRVNGSFLDGIIRQSLDRKPGDIPHGALLDQLLIKNPRQQHNSMSTTATSLMGGNGSGVGIGLHTSDDNTNMNNCNNSSNNGGGSSSSSSSSISNKRSAGSPLNFAQSDIKRERASPTSSIDTDAESNNDHSEMLPSSQQPPKLSIENLLKYHQHSGGGGGGGGDGVGSGDGSSGGSFLQQRSIIDDKHLAMNNCRRDSIEELNNGGGGGIIATTGGTSTGGIGDKNRNTPDNKLLMLTNTTDNEDSS